MTTSTQRAYQDQADGLGYCPKCDHEYTDAQVESFDPELLNADIIDQCPNCHTEEERILYWCNQDPTEPLHAPSDCERFHRER